MKKSNKKEIPNIKEIMEDANKALEVIDDLDNINIENFDIEDYSKKINIMEKELSKKYKNYNHSIDEDIKNIEKRIREDIENNVDTKK